MDENTIVEFTGRDSLNDLLKNGAEKLLSAAIEAEVEALLARFEDRRTAGAAPASFVMATTPNAQFRPGSGL